MTKLAFIGEGETDVMVVKSIKFQKILNEHGFDFVGARDAGGRGNLQQDNGIVDSQVKSLVKNGAEKIIILTDLENYPCIIEAKNSIASFHGNLEIIIISKAMEALFLADSDTLSIVLNNQQSYIFPEKTTVMPFEEINQLFLEAGIKPVKSKVKLTNRFLNHGFDLLKAAEHPYCKSAKYLIRKLKELSEEE